MPELMARYPGVPAPDGWYDLPSWLVDACVATLGKG